MPLSSHRRRLRTALAGAALTAAAVVSTVGTATVAVAQDGAPVEGVVESLDPVSGNVTGWARQGSDWVYLRVVVDGQDARLEVPTDLRPDVGDHGFTSGIPPQYLDGQPHTLTVYAQKFADPSSPRTVVPNLDGSTSRTFSILNRAPGGYVDSAAGTGQGWCQDPDAPTTACTVGWAVYDGDPADDDWRRSPVESGRVEANQPRADLGADSGFSIPIPDAYKTGGYYLRVTALDTAGNENVQTVLPGATTSRPTTQIPAGNLTGTPTATELRLAPPYEPGLV